MSKPKPLHLVDKPLSDAALKTYDNALRNLQGNILKSHGRDHTAHIFIRFSGGKQAAVKRWLSDEKNKPTSMTQQLEEAAEYSLYKVPGSLFRGVYLTAEGYRYLKLAPDGKAFDSKFLQGMQGSQSLLDDPDVKQWDRTYQKTIHAMILLADDGETFIGRNAREIVNQVKDGGVGTVVGIELGAALRNLDDDSIEHFGYADGRSQPLMLERDIKKELANEGIHSFKHWNPAAGPNLALRKDPYGGSDGYGSYFVFRKLEQDVAGFKRQEKELAIKLGLIGSTTDLAGALAMGRFTTGNPVELSDRPELPATTEGKRIVRNDFNYNADPIGARCPIHAHTRKTNPRGESKASLAEEKKHRVIRRGVTYGKRSPESLVDDTLMPRKDVGLLFMCFQADIGNQFEFIQQNWSNNVTFREKKTGIDPVIGQGSGGNGQSWPTVWANVDPDSRERSAFGSFVTMKGGEYFFAPSLSFIASLTGKE